MARIKDVIKDRKVVCLDGGATIQAAVQVMTEAHVGCLVVTEEDKPKGIFTERDLMTRVVQPKRDPQSMLLREAMTTEIYTATLDQRVREVSAQLRQRHIRHVPIMEAGKLHAILSLRDLLGVDLRERQEELEHLTDYIQGESPMELP